MPRRAALPADRSSRRSAPVPRPPRAVLLALLAVLGAAPAGATVVIEKDFAALCREADLIFVGTVTDVTSEWSDAQHRAIRTRVTFGDLTWVRGGSAATVTLRFAGGELDGLREEIAGVPRFAVGERRVLFARDGAYLSPLVGFSQGQFQVVDGADGPVVLDADGRPVPATDRAALQQGAGDAAPSPVSLDAFLTRVRSTLEDR
ncbi:MAG: hypothetical protein SF182_08105 [Deltaproteobacteria bacterium]|nr:hypothetical protein [Deltaproteobacteria bacterium]